MKVDRVHENISSKFVHICHTDGKINLANIFMKELKGVSNFIELHDIIMMCPLPLISFLFKIHCFLFSYLSGGGAEFQILF
jgi:hypothetical protein